MDSKNDHAWIVGAVEDLDANGIVSQTPPNRASVKVGTPRLSQMQADQGENKQQGQQIGDNRHSQAS